jgi:hypothetical protein
MNELKDKPNTDAEKNGTSVLRRALDRIRLAESYPVKDGEPKKRPHSDGWFISRKAAQTVRVKVA